MDLPTIPQEIQSNGTFYEKDGTWSFKCNCGKIRSLSKNMRNQFSNIKQHLKECSEVHDDDDAVFAEPFKTFSSFSFEELPGEACPFWDQKYVMECKDSMSKSWSSLGYILLAVCFGFCIAAQHQHYVLTNSSTTACA